MAVQLSFAMKMYNVTNSLPYYWGEKEDLYSPHCKGWGLQVFCPTMKREIIRRKEPYGISGSISTYLSNNPVES